MAYKFDKKEEHLFQTYIVDVETAKKWLRHYGKELSNSDRFSSTHVYYQFAKEVATRLANHLGREDAISQIDMIHKQKLKAEKANGRIDYGSGRKVAKKTTKKVTKKSIDIKQTPNTFGLKPSN